VLSEPELVRAMFDVGYFPPNTPSAQMKRLGSEPNMCLGDMSVWSLAARSTAMPPRKAR
jgi:hypothetical protein